MARAAKSPNTPVDMTINPPRVRPLAADDYDAWLPLWSGYNAFYGRAGATALALAITQTTWSRLLDPSEPVFGLLAENAESNVLGLVHFLYHRSTILIGPTCYLQDLFTSPAARGRGVGRALIEAVYAQAARDGAERVYWHTQESNATARALYDRIAEQSGFIVYRKSIDAT